MAFLCAAIFAWSLLAALDQAARLTADPYVDPLPQERAERCRARLAELDWPGPDTAHTFTVGWILLRSLLLVDRAWPGHCAVVTVHQAPAGHVRKVTVHAATGGDLHKQALVRVTSHNQGLPPPPTAAEAKHIFALRQWDYARD